MYVKNTPYPGQETLNPTTSDDSENIVPTQFGYSDIIYWLYCQIQYNSLINT